MANNGTDSHGRIPDIHGSATAEAAAVTTLVVYALSLDNVTVPGVVAASLTTVVAIAFGILRGSRYATNRRSTDPKVGG